MLKGNAMNYIKQLVLLCLLLCASCGETTSANNDTINILPNQYGLLVLSDTNDYHKLIAQDSANQLINLESVVPNIKLDIRYATANNFTGQQVYDTALAFLRLTPARALAKVQAELKQQNIGLLVYDAYRPYSITIKFYEIYKDTNFVAAPWLGSRHNRGCAVDVSLIDLSTNKELEMPTAYDDFTEKAKPSYDNIPETAKKNRKLLIDIMARYNFVVHHSEWWHFDYVGWEKFYLMDIPFQNINL